MTTLLDWSPKTAAGASMKLHQELSRAAVPTLYDALREYRRKLYRGHERPHFCHRSGCPGVAGPLMHSSPTALELVLGRGPSCPWRPRNNTIRVSVEGGEVLWEETVANADP